VVHKYKCSFLLVGAVRPTKVQVVTHGNQGMGGKLEFINMLLSGEALAVLTPIVGTP